MGSAADTTNGLATPPRLPAAKPLVYITGSPTANTQCVAEYLALLLGDEAILIDQPSASARTPPPPSSTPPTGDQPAAGSSTTRQHRPRNIRLPPRSRSASIATITPPTAGSSSSDRLLATLTSHPLRTAILTDGPNPTSTPFQAASQTGRPLVSVRLQPHTALTASEPVPSTETPAPPQHNTNDPTLPAVASAVLTLPDSHGDPHAAALRIAAFVREMNARRRSHGDWDAVNYGKDDRADLRGNVGGGDVGGWGQGGQGEYVCGVITPVLTPAEEREIRF